MERVASVLPESTTKTASTQSAIDARQSGRLRSSLYVRTMAVTGARRARGSVVECDVAASPEPRPVSWVAAALMRAALLGDSLPRSRHRGARDACTLRPTTVTAGPTATLGLPSPPAP